MPKLKLNRTNIRAIVPPLKGQVDYYDTELRGLLLRVGTRSKVYYVRVSQHGKIKRIRIANAQDMIPEKARSKAHEILGQIAEGIELRPGAGSDDPRNMTLVAAFNEMMSMRSLKPKTQQFYRQCIRVGLKSLNDKPLSDITPKLVLRTHAKLGNQSGQAYADGCMRVLRLIFNFIIESYRGADGMPIIEYNPVKVLSGTKSWYQVKRRTTIIANTDQQQWLKAVLELLNATHRDYLLLVWLTGLRAMEAATLKWGDVNLRERTLKVGETKNGEPLEIPLSHYLLDLLTKRRKAYPQETWVFPSLTSGPGHLTEPRAAADKVSKTSGVKFTTHDLRRGFITACYELGLSPYTIKMLVNHKLDGGDDVTMGYIISNVESLREPMQRITDHFLALAGAAELKPAPSIRSKPPSALT